MSDVTTELANEANDKAAEIARLKSDNAKLRELCADMLSEDMDQHWPEFTRRARELGVDE